VHPVQDGDVYIARPQWTNKNYLHLMERVNSLHLISRCALILFPNRGRKVVCVVSLFDNSYLPPDVVIVRELCEIN